MAESEVGEVATERWTKRPNPFNIFAKSRSRTFSLSREIHFEALWHAREIGGQNRLYNKREFPGLEKIDWILLLFSFFKKILVAGLEIIP